MTDARPLAVVNDYAGMLAAFRQAVDAHDVPHSEIDAVAGLASGHVGKLLAGLKGFGPLTLGPVLTVLELELWVMPRTRTIGRAIRKRHANGGMRTAKTRVLHRKSKKKKRKTSFNTDSGRRARAIAVLGQTAEFRTRLARRAAVVRWSAMKEAAARAPITGGGNHEQ